MKTLYYFFIPVAIICSLFSFTTNVAAQDIDEAFFHRYLAQNVYSIDSDAAAVVLYEKNTVEVTLYVQRQEIHRIIKILKPSAFECANVTEEYHVASGHDCYIDHIKGATYNLEGNSIIQTDMPQSDIYKQKLAGDLNDVKFSLPAIKEGSIIEYSFERVEPVGAVLPAWHIEGEYPKLKSIYDVYFPPEFFFISLSQLSKPFEDYKSERAAEEARATSYAVINEDASVHNHLWVRKNIHAVKDEPYVNNIINDRERMELQLSSVRLNGRQVGITDTWEKFDEVVWNKAGIKKQVTAPNKFLDDITDSLTQSCATDADKARAIFRYVRSNFTANASTELYTKRFLATIFENKGGSKAEINWLLIAMMHKAGLNALPVVLSTTGNLQANRIYPIKERFNYVICAVKLDTGRLLLDASDKYNSFNALPTYCYNGYARLVDDKGQGLMLTPDNTKEREVATVQITDISESGMKVNVMEKFGNATSAEMRKEWIKDDKAFKKYVREGTLNYPGTVTITNSEVHFLNEPDTNLTISYTCDIKFDNPRSMYYLKNDFITAFNKNPFKATVRQLPVEFPYKMDYMCATTVQLPKDFKVEDVPKPAIIDYENGEMTYKKLSGYNEDAHRLTINTHFVSNQTTYPVDGYETLREFFDKMLQEQNNMVTLKKTE